MGEQGAKALRGLSIDVIFNGSDKRKSMGLAEVRLTFEMMERAEFLRLGMRCQRSITTTGADEGF